MERLTASVIDSMNLAIQTDLKADIPMLEDKFEATDEYRYYQDARDLENLLGQLDRIIDRISGIVREYRP